MTLWTSAEAAEATAGQVTAPWEATGVSIDTRTLQPGNLFVALKDVRDGHDFVAQALEKGAAAALVSRVPEGVSADAPLLIVADVLTGLEALGRAARARTAARVLAITGSVGKTSTKEMARAALQRQGRTHAAEASYNNHWGVPLTLARMPRETEFAVIEIGMNHPGEIAPLARMARPHVVVVTTVGAAHLEAFEDIDGIAREKGSICEGLEPEGVAVLNADIAQTELLVQAAEAAHVVRFGVSEDAAYRLGAVDVQAAVTVAQIAVRGVPMMLKVGSEGRHFAMNALAVLAAAEAMGADPALTLMGLAEWSPPAGRGAREVIALDPVEPSAVLTLLDDSYNANPTSLGAALDVLAATSTTDDVGRIGKGRRIAFLGDMKELGGDAEVLHEALVHHPAMAGIDRVHCIGPLMARLHAALPADKRGHWTETSEEMVPLVPKSLDAGDAVLAKGSLSMKLALIVDAVRNLGHPQGVRDDD